MSKAVIIFTIVLLTSDFIASQVIAPKKPKIVEVDEVFKLLAEQGLYQYWADHRSSGELHITEYLNSLAEKKGNMYIKTVSYLVDGCNGRYKCDVRSEYDPYEDTDSLTVNCDKNE